ncbi:zinc-ribbon domain-containing protein [Anaerobium acetethylicum]|uniref:Zinc-ribbon domain-containing protein n=1 Tax=Anaerobium acetethylicum TaxID=1619234 RepID=A0A1D3TSS7_9FIRM|nr:zinc ribbon domain-containing protein [Anaerobium acetethylicum]SCP96944.1 zinc-ribbon domain-containing protein [Anaerobium acetethylicum]
MFCENCGHKMEEDAAFCENCGQPVNGKAVEKEPEVRERATEQESAVQERAAEQEPAVRERAAEQEPAVRERAAEQEYAFQERTAEHGTGARETVKKQEKTEAAGEQDQHVQGHIVEEAGTYNWMYEFSLWKNPSVFITVYKVMLISLAFPALLMFFLTLEEGVEEAFKLLFAMIGYGIILITGLTIVAYVFLGILYGGRYYVLFKMDAKGINHIQLEKQYKKAQALGFLTALTGVSAGSLSAGGAGLLAASRQSLYTSFKKVKSIKICPGRNTIYLNESMARNQIYATKEEFQFVKEYILKNCPKNVRVIEK